MENNQFFLRFNMCNINYMYAIWLLTSSCSSTHLVSIHYAAKVNTLGKNDKTALSVKLPKPRKIEKKGAIYTGDYHTEMRIFYRDSSIFYITNNTLGSRLNYANRLRIGNNSYIRDNQEILSVNGMSGNKYWREILVGQVAMGYIGADSIKKSLFDKGIEGFAWK